MLLLCTWNCCCGHLWPLDDEASAEEDREKSLKEPGFFRRHWAAGSTCPLPDLSGNFLLCEIINSYCLSWSFHYLRLESPNQYIFTASESLMMNLMIPGDSDVRSSVGTTGKVEGTPSWTSQVQVLALALPLNCWATWGKSYSLSEPQLPHVTKKGYTLEILSLCSPILL